MKKITWGEKVDMILIYPHVTIRQIEALFGIGQPSAMELRDKALKLAEKEGRWTVSKKAPTDLVIKAAGLDYDYFRNMAMKESVARSGKNQRN
ncbi:MAG: hypothetical protein IJI66_03360 [Erysipelotrichaceae bacterium]|nr:hypothetical protein [Erysipelotrichaceae bacterium]